MSGAKIPERSPSSKKTLNGIKSAWVKDHQVSVKGGKVTEHRVVLKITFVLD